MSDTLPEYLKYFGEIKFAEEKSMSASDFERSLNKHFSIKTEKIPRGRYKFAEINNPSTDDFEESFNNYFE
ncbi:unnamed protein product [marine sediment metagenome]|uniref:Uncharacterized protein n=1 Tax=marine sediment metagenome TaxID=412755 RepID=X1FDK0_9ZZZZ